MKRPLLVVYLYRIFLSIKITPMKIVLLFLIIINILTILAFILDKKNAIQGRRRVSEFTLHILALLGGVYMMMLMMFIIHHKTKKFSFYIITLVIAVIWLFVIYHGLDYYLTHYEV